MRALLLTLLIALPGPALAQSWPAPTGYGADAGDRHRWEMERLRARSDANEALAREQDIQTRLTILELQAARRPALSEPTPYRALRSPAEERTLRESATVRREETVRGVTQIDAWLDRAPR